MITIIDYGAGNIKSVQNALDYLGVQSKITSNPKEIEQAKKVIFPGVGSFGFMMNNLKKKGLDIAIKKFISSGKPFLGICLGLQALFERSEESPNVKGLGIFEGNVAKFKQGKVPQVGWNVIQPKNSNIIEKGYMYFVNSYYVIPKDKLIVVGTTDYYCEFVSAVKYNNIFAVQFHPEKSGDFGIELLRRWLKC